MEGPPPAEAPAAPRRRRSRRPRRRRPRDRDARAGARRCGCRSSACSPRATCSSRTCPGWGRPCSRRRSHARSTFSSRGSSSRPTCCPSDVTGVNVYDQQEGRFRFRPGPVFANVLLVDEVNRASPKTQSALLEAMQETQVTVDGETYELERPFLAIATQNPVEYEGTYPLPEAQLDRFAVRMSIGYPPLAEEARMLSEQTGEPPLDRLEPVAGRDELLDAIAAAREIFVEESVNRYVVALLRHTRGNRHLALGASPRSGIALLRLAKARAARRAAGVRDAGRHPRDGRSRCSRTGSCSRPRRARPVSAPRTSSARRSTGRPYRCETEKLRAPSRSGSPPSSPRGRSGRRRSPSSASGSSSPGSSPGSGRAPRAARSRSSAGCCPATGSRAATSRSRSAPGTGAALLGGSITVRQPLGRLASSAADAPRSRTVVVFPASPRPAPARAARLVARRSARARAGRAAARRGDRRARPAADPRADVGVLGPRPARGGRCPIARSGVRPGSRSTRSATTPRASRCARCTGRARPGAGG